MRFARLLELVGTEPVFESSLLLAGDVDPNDVRRQLSRWVAAGRLVQLRRGLYALAEPYRLLDPHPFVVANALVAGSCVSLHSALSYHGLIPEAVAVTTSVGPGRPEERRTPLGRYSFRHLAPDLLGGYRREDLGRGQHALVATPEKALLDLVHLEPGADDAAYLRELRLQGLDRLRLGVLEAQAEAADRPKLCRAAARIAELAAEEAREYQLL